MDKLGLYIHIPYCESKCGYCDFTSYTNRWDTVDAYLAAVVKEAAFYRGAVVNTVYIGGGTPSCLQQGSIANLLEQVSRYITVDSAAEISIEANPNSFTAQKAKEFFGAGINRLSIGLQTTDANLLKLIGRIHIYEDFLRALENALVSGFTNISADLMYALPTQTVEQAAKSAATVAALPIQHISAYALRLEPDTPMFGMEQPQDDIDREMFYAMMSEFSAAGFERYEISNFAKQGYACCHNLKYWREQEYIGLGVAAHSYYRGMRFGNTDSIDVYLTKMAKGESAVSEKEAADTQFETVMLKTRLCEGLPLAELPNTDKINSFLRLLEQNGLATRKNGNLILTNAGMDIHNTIVLELTERLF